MKLANFKKIETKFKTLKEDLDKKEKDYSRIIAAITISEKEKKLGHTKLADVESRYDLLTAFISIREMVSDIPKESSNNKSFQDLRIDLIKSLCASRNINYSKIDKNTLQHLLGGKLEDLRVEKEQLFKPFILFKQINDLKKEHQIKTLLPSIKELTKHKNDRYIAISILQEKIQEIKPWYSFSEKDKERSDRFEKMWQNQTKDYITNFKIGDRVKTISTIKNGEHLQWAGEVIGYHIYSGALEVRRDTYSGGMYYHRAHQQCVIENLRSGKIVK